MLDLEIQSVDTLGADAAKLYNTYVMGTGDDSANAIRESLAAAITTMKEFWAGKDAGVQINNVIQVYNALGTIANGAGNLAKLSVKAAQTLRDLQNSNGAGFNPIDDIFPVEMTDLPPHVDDRDTVSITSDVLAASTNLTSAVDNIGNFKNNITNTKTAIETNWTRGESLGRSSALENFQSLIDGITKYQEYLTSAVDSVKTAFDNYNSL